MHLIIHRHLADGIRMELTQPGGRRSMEFSAGIDAEFPPGDFEYHFPTGWPSMMQVCGALESVGATEYNDNKLEWFYHFATSSFLNTLCIYGRE